MKLHLGCGSAILPGFENIDARPLPGVDKVDDIRTLAGYHKETIDLIYVSHVLEHVKRKEYAQVLSRWYDLLRVGGTLRIAVPDIEAVFSHYSEHKDLRLLRGFLYGGQDHGFNYHYCGWDFATMREDLMAVGFKTVERYDWRKTEHAEVDDYSQCYLPHLDKENGKLMSLNVEAKK